MGAHISHTSSGEWQSFEARMRRRRAERCILRAEVAAQQGSLDEARAAIDEARKLAPSLAEIDTVEANIFGREETSVPEPSPVRSRALVYTAAAIACIVALSMGFVWWQQHIRPTQPVAAPATERAPIPEPAATANPASRPAPSVRVETFDVTATSVEEPPVAPPPVAATLEARADAPAPFVPTTTPEPAPQAAPPVEPANLVRREPAPEPAVRRDTFANLNPPVPALREVELASTPSASAAASPIPAPAPPRIDENSAVRTVLHRYADAYSRLDASAAQEVWPGVNRAALSRAFESLASQDISLGDCAVNVSGASARATCAGAATWAPKVGGGGARTEPRAWTFQLAKADAGWQIVNARVQNR
jgi:hypothetical protein